MCRELFSCGGRVLLPAAHGSQRPASDGWIWVMFPSRHLFSIPAGFAGWFVATTGRVAREGRSRGQEGMFRRVPYSRSAVRRVPRFDYQRRLQVYPTRKRSDSETRLPGFPGEAPPLHALSQPTRSPGQGRGYSGQVPVQSGAGALPGASHGLWPHDRSSILPGHVLSEVL